MKSEIDCKRDKWLEMWQLFSASGTIEDGIKFVNAYFEFQSALDASNLKDKNIEELEMGE